MNNAFLYCEPGCADTRGSLCHVVVHTYTRASMGTSSEPCTGSQRETAHSCTWTDTLPRGKKGAEKQFLHWCFLELASWVYFQNL